MAVASSPWISSTGFRVSSAQHVGSQHAEQARERELLCSFTLLFLLFDFQERDFTLPDFKKITQDARQPCKALLNPLGSAPLSEFSKSFFVFHLSSPSLSNIKWSWINWCSFSLLFKSENVHSQYIHHILISLMPEIKVTKAKVHFWPLSS